MVASPLDALVLPDERRAVCERQRLESARGHPGDGLLASHARPLACGHAPLRAVFPGSIRLRSTAPLGEVVAPASAGGARGTGRSPGRAGRDQPGGGTESARPSAEYDGAVLPAPDAGHRPLLRLDVVPVGSRPHSGHAPPPVAPALG